MLTYCQLIVIIDIKLASSIVYQVYDSHKENIKNCGKFKKATEPPSDQMNN